MRTRLTSLTPRLPVEHPRYHRSFGWALLFAAVLTAVVGGIGGELTVLGPWYQALQKPWWQPPDWAFPIVWSTIFLLSVFAMAFAWRDVEGPVRRGWVVFFFVATGALNILWSYLFFTLQRPDYALVEVGFLWLCVLLLVLLPWRDSKTASLLFFPYLVWVTIASYLTWTVVQLNGPFV